MTKILATTVTTALLAAGSIAGTAVPAHAADIARIPWPSSAPGCVQASATTHDRAYYCFNLGTAQTHVRVVLECTAGASNPRYTVRGEWTRRPGLATASCGNGSVLTSRVQGS